MKNILLSIAVVVITATSLTSCREEKETTTIIKEVEAPEKESEGMLERAAQKVDDKVNKEVNKEIEKIGDDN